MKFKSVMRYSPAERLFRVFRITWDGDWPRKPAHKISFAIRVRPCLWPLRFRHAKSYGGNFA